MIADLMPLAADIFHALNVRRTDHGKLARMIELFAATLGGLNDFIERCGEAYEVPTKGLEECNREFGQLRDVIGSGFRRFRESPQFVVVRTDDCSRPNGEWDRRSE